MYNSGDKDILNLIFCETHKYSYKLYKIYMNEDIFDDNNHK